MEANDYVKRKYMHAAPKRVADTSASAAAKRFWLVRRAVLIFNIAAAAALIAFALSMVIR